MKVITGLVQISIHLILLIVGCKLAPAGGDKAPGFDVSLDSGARVELMSLRGRNGLILYFYPRDETPGRITPDCSFQDKLLEFEREGYRVVCLGEDTGVTHPAFKSKRDVSFVSIKDTQKTLAKLYNVPATEIGFR